MKLLACFPALRLKKGFALRAYVYRDGFGNGNGLVWAMPADLPFPEPETCPGAEGTFVSPPRPPGALDDFMEAVEGDGSPWSYLCASVMARELREFGALWHGCYWSTHVVLGSYPWEFCRRCTEAFSEHPPSDPDNWRWLEPEPTRWEPQISVGNDAVTVTFYTYTALGCEQIVRHVDTFRPGSYTFGSDVKIVATGLSGYVF